MTDYIELRCVASTGQTFNYGSSTKLVDLIENILFRRVILLTGAWLRSSVSGGVARQLLRGDYRARCDCCDRCDRWRPRSFSGGFGEAGTARGSGSDDGASFRSSVAKGLL